MATLCMSVNRVKEASESVILYRVTVCDGNYIHTCQGTEVPGDVFCNLWNVVEWGRGSLQITA